MLWASFLAVFAVVFSVKLLKQKLDSPLGTYEEWAMSFLLSMESKEHGYYYILWRKSMNLCFY